VNDDLVKAAIKKLISDNSAALVAGLTAGPHAKVIGQLTTSRYTVPTIPIFVWIDIPRSYEHYDAEELGNALSAEYVVNRARRINWYDVELHIGDYASTRTGEKIGGSSEQFETDVATFEVFVKRLAQLFRTNYQFQSVATDFTLEVADGGNPSRARPIDRRDLSSYIRDAKGGVSAGLYNILSFRIETCGEPTPS
jgi:hypothetical protein